LLLAAKMTELHTLIVSGKPETVAVYQKSKSVWVARAPYMGKPIRVEDRSEAAALERWQAAAEGEAAPRKAAVGKKTAGKAATRKAPRKIRNKGKPAQRKS
jgi:hypothetical protein